MIIHKTGNFNSNSKLFYLSILLGCFFILLKSKVVIQSDKKAIVNLSKPENSVSPGQACVFYTKDNYGIRLLGGGWIQSTK